MGALLGGIRGVDKDGNRVLSVACVGSRYVRRVCDRGRGSTEIAEWVLRQPLEVPRRPSRYEAQTGVAVENAGYVRPVVCAGYCVGRVRRVCGGVVAGSVAAGGWAGRRCHWGGA